MTDENLEQEIDRLLSSLDAMGEKYVQKQKLRKKLLNQDALTAWGVLKAIRDAQMGKYRINFTFSDEEAEELIRKFVERQK
jgi:hypothetical protein